MGHGSGMAFAAYLHGVCVVAFTAATRMARMGTTLRFLVRDACTGCIQVHCLEVTGGMHVTPAVVATWGFGGKRGVNSGRVKLNQWRLSGSEAIERDTEC